MKTEPSVAPRREDNPPAGSGDRLGELKDLFSFLQNLWGLLAGAAVLFPLSAAFIKVMPLRPGGIDGGAFDAISPTLITTVTTIGSLFTLLWLATNRRAWRTRVKLLRQKALTSAIVAGVTLVAYLAGEHIKRNGIELEGRSSAHVYFLLFEVALMTLYATTFIALTRAFVLLGLVEYFASPRSTVPPNH
jgi:hypothetical protein